MRLLLLASVALAWPAYAGNDGDRHIADIADEYWHARVLGRHAGNRLCAIAHGPRYDDPASPARLADERMRRIETALNARQPGIIAGSRPRTPFPPPQALCEDTSEARRALRNYDAQIGRLEAQLGLNLKNEG